MRVNLNVTPTITVRKKSRISVCYRVEIQEKTSEAKIEFDNGRPKCAHVNETLLTKYFY